MNILVNHTLRSIKSNKGQFATILITIIIVTALIFVSLTVGSLFYNLNVSIKSRLGSQTDITITGDIFSEARLNEFIANNSDKIEYVDTYLELGALFKNEDSKDNSSKVVMVEATDTKLLAERYPEMLLIQEEYKEFYQYPSVWVGQSFVDENSLEIGDEVEIYLEMYRSYQKMTITYIFENEGFFANSTVNNVIIDYDSINAKGMLNLANIKLINDSDYDQVSKDLYEYMGNDNLTVDSSIDYEFIESIVEDNQQLLNISLIFIVALMLFILFTSYLVVTKNRLNEMVIFKAVGATPTQTTLLMVIEAIIYGVIGASIGLALGRICMGIAVEKVIPTFTDAIQFTFMDYFISFILGVAMSVAGAIIPVVNISKENIRQLTASNMKMPKDVPIYILAIVSVLLVACILLLIFVQSIALYTTIALIIIGAIWVVLIIPYVITAVSKLFSFGNGAHRIASFSIKRNSFSRTLSAMVGSVITFTFIVISIITIIISALTPFNTRFEGDFVIQAIDDSDLNIVNDEIDGIYGVESSFVYNYTSCMWITDTQTKNYFVYTVDNSDAIEGLTEGVTDEVIERFNSETNPVIISYDLEQRFGLEIGDKLNITIGDEVALKGTLDSEFVVVGIDYAMANTDRIMVISSDDFTIGGEIVDSYDSMIFVNAQDYVWQSDLYGQLRDSVENDYCYILEFDNWAYASSIGIDGIISLLTILQIVVSGVALIGIINLTIVTLLSRKREFEIYNSVGMDKKRYLTIILGEGVIIAVCGALIGLVLSIIVNRLMPTFAIMIDRFIVYEFFPINIVITIGICIALYILIYLITSAIRKGKYVFDRNVIN
jgi:putative ABC transport system permease protein